LRQSCDTPHGAAVFDRKPCTPAPACRDPGGQWSPQLQYLGCLDRMVNSRLHKPWTGRGEGWQNELPGVRLAPDSDTRRGVVDDSLRDGGCDEGRGLAGDCTNGNAICLTPHAPGCRRRLPPGRWLRRGERAGGEKSTNRTLENVDHASMQTSLRAPVVQDQLLDEDADCESHRGDQRAHCEHLEPRHPPRSRCHEGLERA